MRKYMSLLLAVIGLTAGAYAAEYNLGRAYVSWRNAEDLRIWGEVYGDTAISTFVAKLYDADGNQIASTTLKQPVNTAVAWHLRITGSSDPDWWTYNWEDGNPSPDKVPTKVKFIINGTEYGPIDVEMEPETEAHEDNWADYFKASVNGEYYFTLQSAIDAAEAGQTVTLLGNVTEKGTEVEANSGEFFVQILDKDITLNFNGKTLAGSLYLDSDSTLKAMDGTITTYAGNKASGIESVGGSIELTNMTVTSSVRHAVRVKGGSAVINSGTYTVTGTSGSYYAVNASHASTTMIKGGKFYGSNLDHGAIIVQDGESSMTISGGEVYNSGMHVMQVGSATITGGKYNGTTGVNPSEGYVLEYKEAEELYEVVKATKWEQLADKSWYTEGTTTEIELTTAKQVAGIAKLVSEGKTLAGVTITLPKDATIDLSGLTWAGIGIYNETAIGTAFQGTFDGNGAKITGLTFEDTGSNKYRGLFNQIYNAKILNLTVSGNGFGYTADDIASMPSSMGGAMIVGNSISSTLQDCTAEGIFVGTHNVAGVVVRIVDTDIIRCTNKATLIGSYTKLGGIVNISQHRNIALGNGSLLQDCVNEGVVESTAKGENGVAGIIAYVGYGDDAQNPINDVTIKGCSNKGSVSSASTTARVGQIVGSAASYLTIGEGNTGFKNQIAIGDNPNFLNFATVDGDIATYVTELKAGNVYLVTAPDNALNEYNQPQPPAKPSITLKAGESITFDTSLAKIDDSGIKTAGVEKVENGKLVTYMYPVAMVGDAYATSLQAAVDAATQGQTVKPLADIQLSTTFTIAADKEIVLDLNGKSITVTKSGDRSLYAFDNKGKLTLTDSVGGGSITARGNYNYGTMVMNGGTIVACDTNGGYGIWNYGNFTMNGGTIKVTHMGKYDDTYGPTGLGNMSGAKALITGGTFEGVNMRAYIIASNGTLEITPAEGKTVSVTAPRAVAVDAGSTVINGGTFIAQNSDATHWAYYYALYVHKEGASVTVNGGTFIATERPVQVGEGETQVSSTATINGGTYSHKPTGTGVTLKDGYAPLPQEDGTYTVAEFTNWSQVANTAWYDADAPQTTYTLTTAEQLAGLAKLVNAGTTFTGVTIKLGADIDLSGATYDVAGILWTPIGTNGKAFNGHFDGNGVTITNLKVNQTADCAGFIGSTVAPEGKLGSVKNIKLHNVDVYGGSNTAAVVGCPHTTDVDNCHVTGTIKINGYGYVGGIGGQSYGDITNCSVIGAEDAENTIHARYWSVGGIVGQLYGGRVTNATVSNLTITGNYYATAGIAGLTQNSGNAVCIVLDNVNVSKCTIKNNGSNGSGSIAGLGAAAQPTYIVNYTVADDVVVMNNDVVTDAIIDDDLSNYSIGTAKDAEGHIDAVLTENLYTTKVTAGTFVTLPDAHLADGYTKRLLENGTWMVFVPVAMIGDVPYASLQAALNAAEAGETVKLVADVALSAQVTISKDLTLDLGGKTITDNLSYGLVVTKGVVTIKNGAIASTNAGGQGVYLMGSADLTLNGVHIKAEGESSYGGVYARDNVTLTVDATSTVEGSENGRMAIFVAQGQPVVHVYGKVIAKSKSPAIMGNGSSTTAPGSTLYIYEGATISGNGGLAIYHPQRGSIYMTGGTVEGHAGIAMKSGTLAISGGTIKGVGSYVETLESKTNGVEYDGGAIVIDSHVGYAGQMNVSISGKAQIVSVNSYALREFGNGSTTNIVSVDITDGTVTSGSSVTQDIIVQAITTDNVSISGGTFSKEPPSAYVATNYKAEPNANKTLWTVVPSVVAVDPDTDKPVDLSKLTGGKVELLQVPGADVATVVAKTEGGSVSKDAATAVEVADIFDGAFKVSKGEGEEKPTLTYSYEFGIHRMVPSMSTGTVTFTIGFQENGVAVARTLDGGRRLVICDDNDVEMGAVTHPTFVVSGDVSVADVSVELQKLLKATPPFKVKLVK